MLWKRLEVGGGWELEMGAGPRRRRVCCRFLGVQGWREGRKALQRGSEREAFDEAGAATASVLCLPKCHHLVHTTGDCGSANAGSLTCFSER